MAKANKTRPQAGFFVPLISDRHGECAGGGDKGDFCMLATLIS
ncbi:antiterminator [Escherichia coli]|nr:antiterminator [Escherichia coli]